MSTRGHLKTCCRTPSLTLGLLIGPLALLLVANPAAGQSTTTEPPHAMNSCVGDINCLTCHALYDDGKQNLPRFGDQETMCLGCHGPGNPADNAFDGTCQDLEAEPLWKVKNHAVTAHLSGLVQDDLSDVITASNARFIQMNVKVNDQVTITSGPNEDQVLTVAEVISETELRVTPNPTYDSSGDTFTVPQVIDCASCHDPHGRRDNGSPDNLRLIRTDNTLFKNVPQTGGLTSQVIFQNRSSDYALPSGKGVCNACHMQTAHHTADGLGADHWSGDSDGDGAQDCMRCHPHDAGFAAVGDDCMGCHLSPLGDLDNWDIEDGTMSRIDAVEWSSVGHGKLNFTNTENPCLNCHDASIGHKDTMNPFRLANLPYGQCSGDPTGTPCIFDSSCTGTKTCINQPSDSWRSNTPNDNCLVCHDASGPGHNGESIVSPPAPPSAFVTSWHEGADHATTGRKGGSLCWDCHDPHGDDSNIKMIGRQLMVDRYDEFGLDGTRTPEGEPVVFLASGEGGDYGATGSPYNRVCNVCHTIASPPEDAYAYRQDFGDASHNAGSDCTGCHPHTQDPNTAFKGPSSDDTCVTCHLAAADSDDWNISNGQKSLISATEWTLLGHSQSVAGFDGPIPCFYCHADDATVDTVNGVNHYVDTNPFRLRNKDATGDGWNSNCLICHKSTATGFDPDGGGPYSPVGASKRIDASHVGSKHGSSTGGQLCWDCHDPHGDDSDGTGSTAGNIAMIGTDLMVTGDEYGLTGTRTSSTLGHELVVFTANGTGADYASATGTLDGVCNVCHTSTVVYRGDIDSPQHFPTEGCTTLCHPHDKSGLPVDQAFARQPQNCDACHGSDGGDSDDWDISNGTKSRIDRIEWVGLGHGGVGLAGTNTCLYCHLDYPGSVHYDPSNPFRLANLPSGTCSITTSTPCIVDADCPGSETCDYPAPDYWESNSPNDNCLVCHGGVDNPSSNSPGYQPSGHSLVNGSLKMNAYHEGGRHDGAGDGGVLCWDCHDPHGDDANVAMIGDRLIYGSADAFGLQGSRTIATVFTSRGAYGDYYDGTNFNGVCNVCHATTTPNFNIGLSNTSHYNSGNACTDSGCHTHENADTSLGFVPAGGGDCRGCHNTIDPARIYSIDEDFTTTKSHHVGVGGSTISVLSNYDCVVCHAEGYVQGGEVVKGTRHNDTACTGSSACIDLYDTDYPNTVFSYDKAKIAASASGVGDWHQGNPDFRDEMEFNLDPFCLSCHDALGATATYASAEPNAVNGGLGDPLDPFNDGTITNSYDDGDRGRVVDIASMVVCGDESLTVGTRCASPPPQGQYSLHAIRGQSTSHYECDSGCTEIGGHDGIPATFFQPATGTYPYIWEDSSVMACADCHTTDGANGAAGNAHGADSEYLLKDSARGATLGTWPNETLVCALCHVYAQYTRSNGHAGANKDYVDSAGQVGASNRVTGNKPLYGLACMSCHGGYGWGSIHGSSQVFDVGPVGARVPNARPAYRFTNGAGLRFYDPGDWSASTGQYCYTLDTTDGWSACTQHGSSYPTPRSKVFTRPLTY